MCEAVEEDGCICLIDNAENTETSTNTNVESKQNDYAEIAELTTVNYECDYRKCEIIKTFDLYLSNYVKVLNEFIDISSGDVNNNPLHREVISTFSDVAMMAYYYNDKLLAFIDAITKANRGYAFNISVSFDVNKRINSIINKANYITKWFTLLQQLQADQTTGKQQLQEIADSSVNSSVENSVNSAAINQKLLKAMEEFDENNVKIYRKIYGDTLDSGKLWNETIASKIIAMLNDNA